MLFNPGGPGGSGFDPIASSGTYIQSVLELERFDIVGFDPRGVDRSNGIQCVDDAYMDAHPYIDDTPEEQELYDNTESSFGEACIAQYGDTLQHYSTINTARALAAKPRRSVWEGNWTPAASQRLSRAAENPSAVRPPVMVPSGHCVAAG